LKYKQFSCLAVLRNSLEKGNEQIKKTIAKTVHDRGNTFDKILINIIENCQRKINQKQISKVKNYLVNIFS
jgi:hypothetical protein